MYGCFITRLVIKFQILSIVWRVTRTFGESLRIKKSREHWSLSDVRILQLSLLRWNLDPWLIFEFCWLSLAQNLQDYMCHFSRRIRRWWEACEKSTMSYSSGWRKWWWISNIPFFSTTESQKFLIGGWSNVITYWYFGLVLTVNFLAYWLLTWLIDDDTVVCSPVCDKVYCGFLH